MTELNAKQLAAKDQVYSATSAGVLDQALAGFKETLPQRSPDKREQIAKVLIEELNGEQPAKRQNRLITMLATIDTPNAAEAVAKYAYSDTQQLDDRIQAWALVSLKIMNSYDDMCSLLQRVLDDENTKNRIRALTLRLLIQCNEQDKEARDKFCNELMAMGKDYNADNKWAVMRALRKGNNLQPLPADVEQRFINELVAPTLKDDFEWQDVQIQAALVLGDVENQLDEAMVWLSIAFKESLVPVLRRYCIGSMRDVAERMGNGRRDASSFNAVMIAALDDENADVRSRAYSSLRRVLKPQAAIELIVDNLLEQEKPSAGLLEALRNLEDNKGRASKALRDHLFDLDPDMVQSASTALTQLGGDQAFRTLFAQRRQAIDKYTEILDNADEKIMGQYNLLMRQARRAFWISMAMHILVFLVGVGILAITFYLASKDTTEFLTVVRGLFGLTGGLAAIILSLFYKNPINNINNSVTRLVKVDVAFLGYMRQINQIDATFKQLFLAPTGSHLKDMKETVSQIQVVVDQSLEKIQIYLATVDSPPPGGLKDGAKKVADTTVSQEGVREQVGEAVGNVVKGVGLGD